MITQALHRTTYIDVPEAVGVFDDTDALQAAIYDLLAVGFTRYDISLLAREEVLREKLGRFYWRSEELEDDPEAPRAPFVSDAALGALEGSLMGGFFYVGSAVAMAVMLTPVSTLFASIAAIAVGGAPAAALFALLARREGKHHKDYYAEQLHRGGILLWVRAADAARQELAVKIREWHSGRDVHVHPWSVDLFIGGRPARDQVSRISVRLKRTRLSTRSTTPIPARAANWGITSESPAPLKTIA